MQEKVCEDECWNRWATGDIGPAEIDLWGTTATSFVILEETTLGQIPELKALIGVQQSPIHHPEGDAKVHTLLVVHEMEKILNREGIGGRRRGILMLAALCHDFGKATHTKWHEVKQKWVAYGHDEGGVPIARGFLERIMAEKDVIDQVLPLVRLHMTHISPKFTEKSVRKIMSKLGAASMSDLILVMKADCLGRGSAASPLPRAVLEELVPIAKEIAAGEACGVL